MRSRRGALHVEATVGVTKARSALVIAVDAIAVTRAALPDAADATVRLRIAAVG